MTLSAAPRRRLAFAIEMSLGLGTAGALAIAVPVSAATLTVTSTTDDGVGYTLREAVADANASVGVADTIDFDSSLLNSTLHIDSALTITDTLTISGLGSGSLSIQRDVGPDSDVFVFRPSAADQDFTVSGITIQGDNVITGSGVVADNSDETPRNVTVVDVTFTDLQNGSAGGPAISIDTIAGTLRVENSSFVSNEGGASGGAISAVGVGTAIVFTDDEFVGNEAAGDGGALYIADTTSSITIERSTFQANVAEGFGGGIYVDQVDLESSLSVDSSTFSADSTGEFGAALAIGTVIGEVTIVNSTLDEQGSEDFAMAADLVAGELNVTYSTVTGGIYIKTNEGTAEVASTIVTQAGGVTILVDVDNPVGVLYSILSSSLTDSMADLGGNQFATVPELGPLQDNGGPTFTRMPLAGSPAIVRGLLGGTPPTFDQRYTGFPRVVGGRVDVGAVETASDLGSSRALAATGQTLNIWIPIIGGVLLLGGAAAIAINVLRRRRQP